MQCGGGTPVCQTGRASELAAIEKRFGHPRVAAFRDGVLERSSVFDIGEMGLAIEQSQKHFDIVMGSLHQTV